MKVEELKIEKEKAVQGDKVSIEKSKLLVQQEEVKSNEPPQLHGKLNEFMKLYMRHRCFNTDIIHKADALKQEQKETSILDETDKNKQNKTTEPSKPKQQKSAYLIKLKAIEGVIAESDVLECIRNKGSISIGYSATLVHQENSFVGRSFITPNPILLQSTITGQVMKFQAGEDDFQEQGFMLLYTENEEMVDQLKVAIEFNYTFETKKSIIPQGLQNSEKEKVVLDIAKEVTLNQRKCLGTIEVPINISKLQTGVLQQVAPLKDQLPPLSEVKLKLKQGGMRDIISNSLSNKKFVEATVTIVIEPLQPCKELELLQKLMPSMALCSPAEPIPGLANKGMYKIGLKSTNKVILEASLTQTQDIFIHNVQIQGINKFKECLKTFINQQVNNLGYNIEKIKEAPPMDEIYIDIIVHNSWKPLTQLSIKLGFKEENLIMTDIPHLQIPHVYCDARICFILQLRISTVYEFFSGKKIHRDFLLGESLLMPFESQKDGKIALRSLPQEIHLRLGPGQSLLPGTHATTQQQLVDIQYLKTTLADKLKIQITLSDKIPEKQKIAETVKVQPKEVDNEKNQKVENAVINDQGSKIQIVQQDLSKLKMISQEWDANHNPKLNDLNQSKAGDKSEYSEFVLYKEEDRFYTEAIQTFEEEMNLRYQQEKLSTLPSREPTVLQRLIKLVIKEYIGEDEVEKFKSLTQEELKFLLKFLVCLVLKNFQTKSILVPKLSEDKERNDSLFETILRENPILASTLEVMSDPKQSSLDKEDKKRLLKLGIGKGLLTQDMENQIFDQSNETQSIKKEIKQLPLSKAYSFFNCFRIEIHFMGFVAPKSLPFGVLWPRQVKFRYQFFTLPETETCTSNFYDSVMTVNQGEVRALKFEEGRLYYLKPKLGQSIKRQRSLSPSSLSSTSEFQKSLNNLQQKPFTNIESVVEDFTIDLSQKIENDNQYDEKVLYFAEYLREKNLTIEIIDVDSQFVFGVTKLPLSLLDLSNQPNNSSDIPKAFITNALELDICDMKSGSNLGKLQLSVTNAGSFNFYSNQDDYYYQQHEQQNGFTSSKGFNSTSKKRKIHSKPINPHDEQIVTNALQTISNIQFPILDEEQRKKLRVERNKLKEMPGKKLKQFDPTLRSSEFSGLTEIQFKNQLEIIDIVKKSVDKERLLEKAKYNGVDFTFTLDAIPGQPQFVNLLVRNPFSSQELFKVYISDTDPNIMEPEFQLVNNEDGEWQYWVEKDSSNSRKIRPNNYDIVSKNNDFILGPYQPTPLLFKFLTFRNIMDQQNQQKDERPLSRASSRSRSPGKSETGSLSSRQQKEKQSKPRKIRVQIVGKGDYNQCVIDVIINPKCSHVDHSFTFDIPAETKDMNVSIPNFLPSKLIFSRLSIYSSSGEIDPQINENDGSVILKFYGKRESSSMKARFYIYDDQFMSKPLAIVEVTLKFHECYRMRLQVGNEQLYNINFRAPLSTIANVYSQNQHLVQYVEQRFFNIANYFPEAQYDQMPISLYKGTMSHIPVKVRCRKVGVQRTVLHCIDTNENTILKSWIIEVDGHETIASLNYEITQLRGAHSVYKFLYKNIFNEPIILQFMSSRPALMQIKGVNGDSQIKFEAQETKEIDLYIPSINTKRIEEDIKLYIYDIHGGEKICDTLDFKIKFEGPNQT